MLDQEQPISDVHPAGAMTEELLQSAHRMEELAKRLVAPGPKAAHVSASETHELAEFVHAAISVLRIHHASAYADATGLSLGTRAGAGNSTTAYGKERPPTYGAPLHPASQACPAAHCQQGSPDKGPAAGPDSIPSQSRMVEHLKRLRAAYAVEDFPVVARLYTTGSPPGRRYRRASTQPGPGEPLCLSSDAVLAVRKKDSHIEQLERLTAISQQIRTPATDISLLAAEHRGLRVDYCGFLKHVRQALQQGAREPALAEMVLQLQAHLREMGQRWYANEVAVVDELLQLYCIESDARAALAAGAQCASRPPAPTGR